MDWSDPGLILHGLAECWLGGWGWRHSLLQYEHGSILLTREATIGPLSAFLLSQCSERWRIEMTIVQQEFVSCLNVQSMCWDLVCAIRDIHP